MRPVTMTVSGVAVSPPCPMDYSDGIFSIGVGVKISATATYTVEHTYDDVWAATFVPATATWFPLAALAAKTTNAEGIYSAPVRAIRLNVAASTGTVTMVLIPTTDPS